MGRRVHEGDEGPRFDRRQHRVPVDGRLERCADQTNRRVVAGGEKGAAGKGVIDVLEVGPAVSVTAERKRSGQAARACALERDLDHRMGVAGDDLIGRKSVQEIRHELEVLLRLGRIGRRFVVVPGQEERHRHAACVIVDDRPPQVVGAGRHAHPQAVQVIFDREPVNAPEAGRGEDVTGMAGIREPRHDRAKALRDAGRGVADAVVVDQQESHGVRGAGAAISGRPSALFLELPSRQPDRGGRQQHQRRGLGNATGGAA